MHPYNMVVNFLIPHYLATATININFGKSLFIVLGFSYLIIHKYIKKPHGCLICGMAW